VDSPTIPTGQVRFYRVAAVNATGEGTTSRGIRVEPGAAALSTPTGFTTAMTARSVTLNWARLAEDVDGAVAEPTRTFVGYNIYRADDPNIPSWVRLNVVPLRSTSFHDLGVDQGHTYAYMLRAVATAGAETAGVTANATPLDVIPPAIPRGVRAVSGSLANQVTIIWQPNSENDLQGYRIYRQDPNTGSFISQGTALPEATSWTGGGLSVGTTYTYAVAAYDSWSQSALSASVAAKPRTGAVGAPVITTAYALLGWGGGSAQLTYGGAGGDTSGYSAFIVYRKEQGLPDDRWERMFTAPVTHHSGIDDEGNPYWAPDEFTPTYTDQWPVPCRVNEYLVSGVDNFGNETVDSSVWTAEQFLVPDIPSVSTQGSQLRFDVTGFVGCSTAGSGFKVTSWTLTYSYTQNWSVVYNTPIDPNLGWVTIPKPGNGYLVSVALTGQVQNLYETTDPNHPVLIQMWGSEDICVKYDTSIDPNDADCKDLDLSQNAPPPPFCYPNCGESGGGGGGPVTLDDSWQVDQLEMQLLPRRRLVFEMRGPAGPFVNPPAGEEGWRVARGLKRHGDEEEVVASSERPRRRDQVPMLPDLYARYLTPRGFESSESLAGSTSISLATSPPGVIALPLALPLPASSVRRLIMDSQLASPIASKPEPTRAAASDVWEQLTQEQASLDGSATAGAIEAGGLNLVPMLITGATTKTFAWQFFSWDHLGSVRVVTDVNGAKVYDSKYLPYGEEIAGSGSPGSGNSHKFTAHERDGEDGIDYLKARYLRSDLFRFLSVDPGRLSVRRRGPRTWNRYTYSIDNPVLYYDRDGRDFTNAATSDLTRQAFNDLVSFSPTFQRFVVDDHQIKASVKNDSLDPKGPGENGGQTSFTLTCPCEVATTIDPELAKEAGRENPEELQGEKAERVISFAEAGRMVQIATNPADQNIDLYEKSKVEKHPDREEGTRWANLMWQEVLQAKWQRASEELAREIAENKRFRLLDDFMNRKPDYPIGPRR